MIKLFFVHKKSVVRLKWSGIVMLCGIMLLWGCLGKQVKTNEEPRINPADTIYLGDLREKFEGDSIFFTKVAPNIVLSDNQYCWVVTESEAINSGLSKAYYLKVKQEIVSTNEAIRRGVMKGANMKRLYDFQE